MVFNRFNSLIHQTFAKKIQSWLNYFLVSVLYIPLQCFVSSNTKAHWNTVRFITFHLNNLFSPIWTGIDSWKATPNSLFILKLVINSIFKLVGENFREIFCSAFFQYSTFSPEVFFFIHFNKRHLIIFTLCCWYHDYINSANHLVKFCLWII